MLTQRLPIQHVALQTARRPQWEFPKLPDHPMGFDLGQTEGEVKAVVTSAMLVPLAISAAVSYVGFRLGSKDEGFPAFMGYGVGILGALGGLSSLMVMLGVMKSSFTPRQMFTTPGSVVPASLPSSTAPAGPAIR
jgi:hypothetical protein